MMKIKTKKLHPDAIVPKYATPGSACFDLHAVDVQDGPIYKGLPVTFRTGLAFEIPRNHTMLIFSRSGHGFKHSTRLENCVGVLDADYRGEAMVSLFRDPSHRPLMGVNNGDRIAQAMVLPVEQVEFVLCDELSDTERGSGGFGSTGQK